MTPNAAPTASATDSPPPTGQHSTRDADTHYDLDLPRWSARDVLTLLGALRETKPRDPLRAAEDALLDVVNGS